MITGDWKWTYLFLSHVKREQQYLIWSRPPLVQGSEEN